MSIVGPRPLSSIYLPYYTKEEMRRHDMRPGLTGWAQVHGRNSTSWRKRFEYLKKKRQNFSSVLEPSVGDGRFLSALLSVSGEVKARQRI